MKSDITVYKQNDIYPVCTTQRTIKEGVVRYKNDSFLVFDRDGEKAIFSDDPIRKPIDRIPDDEVIAQALNIVNKRILRGPFMNSPDVAKSLFVLRHHNLKTETFDVAYLCNRHRLLKVSTVFKGGPMSSNVFPAVIVQEMLRINAQAIVVSHGHPNKTNAEPSHADIMITSKIKKLLEMHELRIIDHIITAGATSVSLAERGEL